VSYFEFFKHDGPQMSSAEFSAALKRHGCLDDRHGAVAHASATPADGAAIARLGQQVDPAINVATKKKSSPTTADSNTALELHSL
jgi:hypothetical protein